MTATLLSDNMTAGCYYSESMMKHGRGTTREYSGFTIVELLIVIVVIGVLAAISVESYRGVSPTALNSSRYAEYSQWLKLFELYNIEYGKYPQVPTGTNTHSIGYCLGSGFPARGGGAA